MPAGTAHSLLERVARPLSVAEIEFVLRRLPGGSSPFVGAALCLPAGELPTAALVDRGSHAVWRTMRLDIDDAQDPQRLHDWVSAGWSDGDESLVPSGELWRWVRVVRSGAGLVLWGPEQMWDAPSVTTTGSVTPQVLFEVAHQMWDSVLCTPFVELRNDGVAVHFDGSAVRVADVVNPSEQFETVGVDSVAVFAESAAARTGAGSWELHKPRAREQRWVLVLHGVSHNVTVPLRYNNGALSAGVAPPADRGCVPGGEDLDDGWRCVGTDAARVVVGHRSGLYGYLTPRL